MSWPRRLSMRPRAVLPVISVLQFVVLPLAASALRKSPSGAPSVSPDGGSATASPNTSGNLVYFSVDNFGEMDETYSLSCGASGQVLSCSAPSSVTVPAGGSEIVDVSFNTGSIGSGTVSLVASGMSGFEDGWYDVNVGGRYAPMLDLTPHNGENRSMGLCAVGCFDVVASYTTPAYVSMDTPRAITLLYRSAQAVPWATVQVDAYDSSSDPADYLSIRIKRPDGSSVYLRNGTYEVYFDRASGYNRLAAQFDASGLATGLHKYTVVVRSYWSDGTVKESSAAINALIVNERSSPYGRGWSIAGLQRYVGDGSGGAVVIEGNGSILHFPKNYCSGDCYYYTPKGDFSTLRWSSGDNTMYRTYPDGTKLAYHGSSGHALWAQDRFGNRTTYSYDGSWRLTRVTDPTGNYYSLAYGSNGKLSSITDAAGRVTTVEHDGYPNLSGIKQPDGQYAGRFIYNSALQMTQMTDAVSGEWNYGYDFAGKLSTLTMPYVTVNGSAVRPQVKFSSLERAVLSETATSSSNQAPARIPDNLRASTTNPRGFATSYRLDRFSNSTRIEEPLGRTTVISLNAHSQPTQVTNPAGLTTYFTWSKQNLTRMYDYTYSRNVYLAYEQTYNQVDSIWGDTKYVRNFWSGGKLDSSRVGTPTARLSRFSYDSKGRLKSAGDPEAHGTSYFRASSGFQNTDSVKNESRKTSYAYDGYGRVWRVKNPGGDSTITEYDFLNRVRRVIGGLNDTTEYLYNNLYLTQVRDPLRNEHAYSPNALGWNEWERDPNLRYTYIRYDSSGNVVGVTNRRNQAVSFTYDALDQLLSRTADGQTTAYKTDPLGRFVATSNGESTDTLWFDLAGRDSAQITGRSGGRLYRLTSSYDKRNLRTQVTMSGAGSWSSSIGYRYNVHFGLDTLIDVAGGRTRISYNADQQPTNYVLPVGSGLPIESGYSSTHRSAKIRYPNHGMIDAAIGFHYGYDAMSRVEERLNYDRTKGRGYTYDQLGRLRQAADFHYESGGECTPIYEKIIPDPDDEPIGYDCPDANKVTDATFPFSYDVAGNRADSGAVIQTGNRLVSFNAATFEYDSDGNLTRKAGSGVLDVNLNWNSLGQLVSATTGAGTTTFGYDGWGRRVRKTGPQGTKHYIYDGDDLFGELDGSYALAAEYTYHPGTDRPHSVRRGGTMYYYGTDHPGNVVGLIDGGGGLVNEYRYAPFGGDQGGARNVENSLRYAARELDTETGFYFNRARYYDGQVGRFISEDPIGLEGGINLYTYTGNSPVNYRDPLGLKIECKTEKFTAINAEGEEVEGERTVCKDDGTGGADEAGIFKTLWQAFGAMLMRVNPRLATAMGFAGGAAGILSRLMDPRISGHLQRFLGHNPIPPGWTMRLAANGNGWVFQRPGAIGNADMIRIMNPTSYAPNGYAVFYNSSGQALTVFGRTASQATMHIPLTHTGQIVNWPR